MAIAIVDERISALCENSLKAHGFDVIKLKGTDMLSTAVRSHPDMLIHVLSNNLIVSEEYYKQNKNVFDSIKEKCPKITFKITNDNLEPKYPKDVKFNLLKLGKTAFGKLDALSNTLKNVLCDNGYILINAKQGYPACTTLPLGELYAITADNGMARVLTNEGVNVLKINDGDILLPPHEYGFIGGCAGVYNGCVYFLGNVDTHTDADKIKDFIALSGHTHTSLSNEKLHDLGGIIFID